MRSCRILFLTVGVALAGCESHDSVYQRTLVDGCEEECLFWSETDTDRGVIGDDGMRVYIEPSFGEFSYRFEIVPQPSGCVAIWPEEQFDEKKNYCGYYRVRMRMLASPEGSEDNPAKPQDYSFILPEEDGREIFGVVDRLSNDWRPGSSRWTDGTPVSLEILKRGRPRSVISNAPLESDYRNPAAWVAAELHRVALAYGPAGKIPRSFDWHSYVDEDGRSPCHYPSLNVPDPDGFGGGDDACARSLAGKPLR